MTMEVSMKIRRDVACAEDSFLRSLTKSGRKEVMSFFPGWRGLSWFDLPSTNVLRIA